MQWLEPTLKDLGGFSIKRFLPNASQRAVGPWVFFDHAGPAIFAAGEGVDVRPHPHIGLATVTYLFEGELIHRDSLGCVQAIRPGDINLMTSGRGIVHSERTDADYRKQDHQLHALQLWLALPDEHEQCEPAFDHYPADAIPEYVAQGVHARVMIGEAHGEISPVKQYAPTLYCEYTLAAGASVMLPEASERALYVLSGQATLSDDIVEAHQMVVLPEGHVELGAAEALQCVLIGGDSVGRRHLEWNFVASSKELIEKAKQDWKDQAFDAISGESEFIPLP